MLSPSTKIINRRETLIAYRTRPSLRDDLLVAQDSRRVERFRRVGAGDWRHEIIQDGVLTFICGGLQMRPSAADLYEDIVLEG